MIDETDPEDRRVPRRIPRLTCTACGNEYDATNVHICSLSVSRARQLAPERGRTHGDFGENAKFADQARDLMRSMKPGWSNCSAEQRLALDEMMLKVGRILSGGAKIKEHWTDLQGYSMLGEKACPNE